jgi:hypothetical protein
LVLSVSEHLSGSPDSGSLLPQFLDGFSESLDSGSESGLLVDWSLSSFVSQDCDVGSSLSDLFIDSDNVLVTGFRHLRLGFYMLLILFLIL